MTTETSSSTNNLENHYGQEVFAWLIEEGEDTVCENTDGKSNESNENNENTNTNNEINNSIFEANSKEKLFQENLFEEENSSHEESTQEETSRSRAGSSSSSSLYTAELVRAHRSVDSSSSSSENEISSPIKPLKAITTQTTITTTSTRNSNSNVYEILQEIKPDHPLRIHTHFDFATTRPSSISLISLNPLLHHHRNSTYNNPSPTSVNYIPPRRYSNFQRSSFYNNNDISKHQSCIEETNNNNNNLTIRQLHPTNITQEKNTHLLHEEKIMYGKYLFWTGFLFMPVWWVGCFYKPSSTEDYKWRKRCRKASTWSFVISIVILTFIVVINQRLKVGL